MQPNPLPPTLQFFGVGWWVLHIVLIGFVYMAGFKAGKRKGMKLAEEAAAGGGKTTA
jgi:hypothetical protein